MFSRPVIVIGQAGFVQVDDLATPTWQTIQMDAIINDIVTQDEYAYNITVQPDLAKPASVKVVTVHVKFVERSKIGGKSEVVYATKLSDI